MIYLYFLKQIVVNSILFSPCQIGGFTTSSQSKTDQLVAQGYARAATSDERDAFLAGAAALAAYRSDPRPSGGTSLDKAVGSDIITGTDDAKYVTAKAIADAGLVTADSLATQLEALADPLTYTALLTNSVNGDMDTPIVLTNTLGVAVNWLSTNDGLYRGSLASGAFDPEKTAINIRTAHPYMVFSCSIDGLGRINLNTGFLSTLPDTFTYTHAGLLNTLFEVKVYP